MPQLDTLTYFSQLFWLIVIFVSFYFVNFKYLQNIDNIFKIRNKYKNITTDSSSFKAEEYPTYSISTNNLIKKATITNNNINNVHNESLLLSYKLIVENDLQKSN